MTPNYIGVLTSDKIFYIDGPNYFNIIIKCMFLWQNLGAMKSHC